jgi:hypothetical protein
VGFGERELRVTWKAMGERRDRYCHVTCMRDAVSLLATLPPTMPLLPTELLGHNPSPLLLLLTPAPLAPLQVLTLAREHTPVHLLTRLVAHCVPPARGWALSVDPSQLEPGQRDPGLTQAADQLRGLLTDPSLALPWWVLGPIELRGPLFEQEPPPQALGGQVIEVQSEEEEEEDEEEGEQVGMPALHAPDGEHEDEEEEEDEDDEDDDEDDDDDDEELDEHALAMWREVLHNGMDEGGEEEDEEEEEEDEEEGGIMETFGLRGLYMFGQDEEDEEDEDEDGDYPF